MWRVGTVGSGHCNGGGGATCSGRCGGWEGLVAALQQVARCGTGGPALKPC